MSHTPHILVLAYVYPPDAGSGTFRTLYFMNNLARQGMRITVLTVKREAFHAGASVDEELVQKIHPNITVVRCAVKRPLDALISLKGRVSGATPGGGASGGAAARPDTAHGPSALQRVKDAVSGLLACPDQHVGWIPDVLRKARELQRREKFDCIYATGGPWSCLLAGALLSRASALPLLVDFRDPWVSNPGFETKGSLIRGIERRMESFVVGQAARLVANTEELRADFMRRYPFLTDANAHTITNGFESIAIAVKPAARKHFSIVHAGELYMSRNPANLLEAIETLVQERKVDQERFRIQFVGGISVKDERVEKLLHSPYLQQVVEIYPRVPHQEALAFQQGADALLLIQPDFPVQIPRKLFEYVALQKPILAITEAASATGNLIRNKQLGMVVENSAPCIGNALAEMYRLWEGDDFSPLDLEDVKEFRNDILAGKLARIMTEMTGGAIADPG